MSTWILGELGISGSARMDGWDGGVRSVLGLGVVWAGVGGGGVGGGGERRRRGYSPRPRPRPRPRRPDPAEWSRLEPVPLRDCDWDAGCRRGRSAALRVILWYSQSMSRHEGAWGCGVQAHQDVMGR